MFLLCASKNSILVAYVPIPELYFQKIAQQGVPNSCKIDAKPSFAYGF